VGGHCAIEVLPTGVVGSVARMLMGLIQGLFGTGLIQPWIGSCIWMCQKVHMGVMGTVWDGADVILPW